MFKPFVTVACVVQAAGQFLIVEELINDKLLWGQPAGHLEAGETLIQAAERELWEETGIRATPQALLKLHQWNTANGSSFLRFCFAIDLPEILPAVPQDSDINRCLWLSANDILTAANLRSPRVQECLICYQQGIRFPLSFIESIGY